MKSRCISECLGPGRIECVAYINAAVSARGRGRWPEKGSGSDSIQGQGSNVSMVWNFISGLNLRNLAILSCQMPETSLWDCRSGKWQAFRVASGSCDKKTSFHTNEADAWAWLLIFADRPTVLDIPETFRYLASKECGGSFRWWTEGLTGWCVCVCVCGKPWIKG